MADQPSGITFFCDDIRMEIGNKPSLMGIYSTGMNVPVDFPFTLQRLACWIRYSEPVDAKSNLLRIHIYLPASDDPAVTIEYPLSEARANTPKQTLPLPSDSRITERVYFIPVAIGPVVIASEGHVRVRGDCDGQIVKMGTLPIRRATIS